MILHVASTVAHTVILLENVQGLLIDQQLVMLGGNIKEKEIRLLDPVYHPDIIRAFNVENMMA
jgi:acyl dehydratase